VTKKRGPAEPFAGANVGDEKRGGPSPSGKNGKKNIINNLPTDQTRRERLNPVTAEVRVYSRKSRAGKQQPPAGCRVAILISCSRRRRRARVSKRRGMSRMLAASAASAPGLAVELEERPQGGDESHGMRRRGQFLAELLTWIPGCSSRGVHGRKGESLRRRAAAAPDVARG